MTTDRFDTSFNNVDPKTGRPFTRGQPDGVWIISILYTLVLVGAFAVALVKVIMGIVGKGFSVGGVLPAVFSAILFIPAIVLLARRNDAAVAWMVGLLVILAMQGVTVFVYLSRTDGLSGGIVAAVTIAVLAQGYAALYTYGLKRDALLK